MREEEITCIFPGNNDVVVGSSVNLWDLFSRELLSRELDVAWIKGGSNF